MKTLCNRRGGFFDICSEEMCGRSLCKFMAGLLFPVIAYLLLAGCYVTSQEKGVSGSSITPELPAYDWRSCESLDNSRCMSEAPACGYHYENPDCPENQLCRAAPKVVFTDYQDACQACAAGEEKFVAQVCPDQYG